jgi:hypothetical protein
MVEYRVRPVVRYVVTRYTEYPEMNATGSSERLGEFDSESYAETVASALRFEQRGRERLESHVKMEREARYGISDGIASASASNGYAQG